MPRLRIIAAVIQSDEALNLEGNSGSTSLSQITELSDEILVDLLSPTGTDKERFYAR